MNAQTAINMGRFLNFVYGSWNSVSKATDLDGKTVLFNGEPVVSGLTYTVLKTIYSNDLATDFHPILDGYTTIGIVAQNSANPTDIVIAIRGTVGVWEWVQDAKFLARPFPPVVGSGLTDDGFTDMYLSFSFVPASTTTFMQNLKDLLPSNAQVMICGHSLGSSLATLLALDMSVNTNFAVTVYTLASPRVGDMIFHNLFNHVVPNTYRIANRLDIVPKTPPPLLYFHVGDETELIPDKSLKFTLVCEHNLSSYLNMLGAQIGQTGEYPLGADCLQA